MNRHDHGSLDGCAIVITIPARNEAGRIVACLDAAAASLKGRGGIVLAVNGSTDETLALAQGWFESTGTKGIVLDDPSPPPGSGVGRARRHAVAACAGKLAPGAVVMTTDADSRVSPDWVDANIAELGKADLICGSVHIDAGEYARLPNAVKQHGAVEGVYMALTLAAYTLLDPVPHDPMPTHMVASGASLAFRMALYNDVGGIPALEVCEDRAFADRAEACGWRVRHSAIARVVTSCRLTGRTSGGMAGTLRARIAEADPLVDELLEPSAQTILRAQMRGTLRRAFRNGAGFGPAWSQLEQGSPAFKRSRMRVSDLKRELPLLGAALQDVPAEPERRSA